MTTSELNRMELKLTELTVTLENIQKNLLGVLDSQRNLEFRLRGVENAMESLKTDIQWIKNLKLPVVVGSLASSLGGLIYLFLKYLPR
jgi:hypothetical protein